MCLFLWSLLYKLTVKGDDMWDCHDPYIPHPYVDDTTAILWLTCVLLFFIFVKKGLDYLLLVHQFGIVQKPTLYNFKYELFPIKSTHLYKKFLP